MALDVQYGQIRSNVIAKLESQKEQMEGLLKDLDGTVQSLPSYMEGDALQAYINEYEQIVKVIYRKLNHNLGQFSDQLEKVCKEFEKLDNDMHTQIGQH